MKKIIEHHLPPISIIVILLLVYAVWLIPQTGVSWDEPFQRDTGILMWNYLTEGDRSIFSHKDRWYGTGFEMLLAGAEYMVKPIGSRAVILLRHTLTFVYNSLGVIALYVFVFLGSRRRLFGVIAALLLMLSPRIGADMVYNSKDSVFLTAVCIAYTLYALHDKKPTLMRSIFVGIAAGYATSIRIIGIILPISFVVLFLWDVIIKRARVQQCIALLIMLVVWAIGLYALWPVLWYDPFGEFFRAYSTMRQFPWEGLVLFRGEFLKASTLPWYYIPWWISISTPISLLAVSVIGIVVAVVRAKESSSARIALVWFWLPLVAVMMLRPVLYDGWRHLYFVYPAMMVLFLFGVDWFVKTSFVIRVGTGMLVIADVVFVFMFTVQTAPYAYVYVNSFTGGYERAKVAYDLDYWGLTLSEGIRWIAKHDPSSHIAVYAPNTVGDPIAYVLPETDRRRMTVTDTPQGAKYFIGNYRWHPQEYPFPHAPVFERRIEGVRVMGVWDISSYNIVTDSNGSGDQ